MRAAVLHSAPGALTIEDVTIDKPGPGEVLIRTVATGLCHSDYVCMEGRSVVPLPALLGHESAGVVEAVGSDVTYLKAGDHVITSPNAFCGECNYCLGGRTFLCSRMFGGRGQGQPPRVSFDGKSCFHFCGLGSFAEMMLVSEKSVVKIGNDVPLDRAALIGCGVTTGVGAVMRTAQVPPGATVAVVGCGGIGLNCIQGASIVGASRIVAVDPNPVKREMAIQFGATDVVDPTESDPVEQVRALFPAGGINPGGVDYSFEAVGSPQAVSQAFRMVNWGGTATVIGFLPAGNIIELEGTDLLPERKIQGSLLGSARTRLDMPFYAELYLQGRLKLDELISARITLDEVNDGFEAMSRGETARSVITTFS